MKRSSRIESLIVGLAALGLTGIASAQQLEEIIVTATHREENLQTVPISVTALSAETLEKADIFDAGTIAQHTPGLAYAEFSPGQANVSMRGISSADDGAGLDNSVALFLDGVYIGRGASINFDMFDLDRVEVLRGPQGTLFGRNAIGGAINVITAKPTDEFQVKIGATAGNEGILRYRGLVSGPLSDRLSGKISATHREHDGFVENLVLGIDQGDEDQSSIRGQLNWSLDSSNWLLSADYMEDDRGDMGRTPVVDNAPLQAILAQNGITGPWQNAASADGHSNRKASGISLTGEIDFEKGVITSITAFRQSETDWEMLSVGAPLGGLGLPFDEVVDDIVEDIDTFSQEFRWTSSLGGKLEYTAGLYFFTEDTNRVEIFRITAAGTYGDPAAPFRLTDIGDQAIIGNEYARTANETTSYAVYGQFTYQFTDALGLTVGGRYTRDEKKYTAESVNCALVAANDPSIIGTQWENFAPCGGVGGSLNIIAEVFEVNPEDSWTDFSPMVALQYFLNDGTMLYGSAARGFKSGGFAGSQGVESSASLPVDQETATNYELGLKGDFADDSLRINAAVFYTDYQDLQVVRFGPVPNSAFGTFVTTNVGSADIKGLELELTWFITERFSLDGYYAYLDTETQDLVFETTGGIIDASGKTLTRAPENTANITALYDLPTGIGDFDFRLSFSHTDEQRTDFVDDRIIQDPSDIWDARIGWTAPNANWDVALWGKNLTDEAYISHMYVIGPGGIGVWGAPRTVGISANFYVN